MNCIQFTLRRRLSLLFSALLLLSVMPAAASAEGRTAGETVMEEQTTGGAITEEQIWEQAFSLALACKLNDYDNREPDSLLLWDAAGWYAALRQRVEGINLLTSAEVEDYLRSAGFLDALELPESWEEYGIVRRLRSSAGEDAYEFCSHRDMLQNMLGVTMEVNTAVIAPYTAVATLTEHYENGATAKWAYRLHFIENPDPKSRFAFRLSGVEAIPFEPVMEGNLDFTWQNLLEANSLEYILRFCPAVCIYDQDAEHSRTWYFKRSGETVRIHEDGANISGQYGRFLIDYETTQNGEKRVRVGAISENTVSDGSISEYLSYLVSLRLDRLDEDCFRLDCTTVNGETERLAVNRGTLWLQEITYDYWNYPSSTTCFEYPGKEPAFDFLNGWDGELRTVTVVWESFEGGSPHTRTEFHRLPADWEYLPYEGRWGDYTVYMDAGYTRIYEYPGDGMDYTLYLTTAKG